MICITQVFADESIVSTLWRQLDWSRFRELFHLEKPLLRDFYKAILQAQQRFALQKPTLKELD